MKHQLFAGFRQVLDLVKESCFAYAGLTRNHDKLAFTTNGGIESLLQFSLFSLSADERRECHTRQHQCLRQYH